MIQESEDLLETLMQVIPWTRIAALETRRQGIPGSLI